MNKTPQRPHSRGSDGSGGSSGVRNGVSSSRQKQLHKTVKSSDAINKKSAKVIKISSLSITLSILKGEKSESHQIESSRRKKTPRKNKGLKVDHRCATFNTTTGNFSLSLSLLSVSYPSFLKSRFRSVFLVDDVCTKP